ncbi:hypothetical protein [Paraburkholderia sp. GAS42]|uniref:hypothetical protein n=1 Tax=Paraburkholderia sp. GAS42 TaxID=3035135 RepID=UPI003D1AB18C
MFTHIAIDLIFRCFGRTSVHFSQDAGISGDETESTHCMSQNGVKSAMKEFSVAVLSLSVVASSGACARVTTPSGICHGLIETQPNGPNNVTETSCPDVNPIFTEQVTRVKQAHLAQPNATTARRPESDSKRIIATAQGYWILPHDEPGSEPALGMRRPARPTCCIERRYEEQGR